MADLIHTPLQKRAGFPKILLAFFATFIIVDILFVTLALRTHTGVVTEQAYEKGLAHNATLAKAQAMQALGWRVNITADTAGVLTIVIADKQGLPIIADSVMVGLTRQVTAGHDFTVRADMTAAGSYSAHPSYPLKGAWNVRVTVTQADKMFETTKAILIQ